MQTDSVDEHRPLLSHGHANKDNASIMSSEELPVGSSECEQQEFSTAELFGLLSGLYIGGFVVALDSTMIATIATPISDSFNNFSLLGWLASSFFVASAVSQPLSGKLTDIYGRREGFLFASLVFTIGNILCTFAGHEWVLILGRIIAGLGGGAIGPIAVFIMSDLIPLRQRGLWSGISNICYGTGSGIGAPIGGFINDTIGWRWAFGIQIPITAISMAIVALKFKSRPTPDDKSSKLARIDWFGAVSLVLALVFLLLCLVSGGNLLPWTHPVVIGAIPLFIVFFILFILVESKYATEPIIDIKLLSIPTVTAVCLTNWFGSMARFALLFYAPLYFQVQKLSSTQVGVRFIPESIAIALGSLVSGIYMRISGRYYYLNLVVGLIAAIGFALLCSLELHTTAWLPFAYLFVTGLSYGGMLTTTLVALIASVDQGCHATTTSASYIFRSTGSVLGITIASVVFQNTLRPRLRNDFSTVKNGAELVSKIEADLSCIWQLSDVLQSKATQSYMEALQAVFRTLFGMALLQFVSCMFIGEHELHHTLSKNRA